MRAWIIDTGPLVAFLDSSDPYHEAVSDALEGFCGKLVTTNAVITEAMHFASAMRSGPCRLSELISASGMAVYDLCQPPEIEAAVALMERYADTPMDFADATLVLMSEAVGLGEILTLDRRGFSTLRRAVLPDEMCQELDAPVLRKSAGIPGGMSSIFRSAGAQGLGADRRRESLILGLPFGPPQAGTSTSCWTSTWLNDRKQMRA